MVMFEHKRRITEKEVDTIKVPKIPTGDNYKSVTGITQKSIGNEEAAKDDSDSEDIPTLEDRLISLIDVVNGIDDQLNLLEVKAINLKRML